MGIPTREDLLRASDLETREVQLPSLGFAVKIRSLPAGYSNLATSESQEIVNRQNAKGRIEQVIHVDEVKLEALKVLHGMVEPKLNSLEDATAFSQNVSGGAWKTLVRAIDELSNLTPEAAEQAEALFRDSGSGEARNVGGTGADEDGSEPGPEAEDEFASGNGRPVVPVRAGA